MIKAVIFDCFGVIITDVLQSFRSEVEASNPEGAVEISDLVQLKNKGLIDPGEANERIAAIIGMSLDTYYKRINEGEYKDGVLMDYIASLRTRYKTAMLSNITKEGLARRFSEPELKDHFDAVVVSGVIGFAKPEAQAYEYVASELGVRLDECVFADDRELFCSAAASVGMKTIHYQDFLSFKKELIRITSA